MMTFPAPRIIVIDDELEHLKGLVQSLNRYGAACLPVHFTGEQTIAPCPQVRVIFADLHLVGGQLGHSHANDFSIIGGLIENDIRPSGPYFIVLWTKYPDQADRLNERLAEDIHNVAKPFSVQALDKKHYLDSRGDVKNPDKLVEAIRRIVAKQPQVGALLNWEEKVLGAAAATVSSIVAMAESAAGAADPGTRVGRLLERLAVEAVGSKHVARDRFRAVNHALLPILADRIAFLQSRSVDKELWEAAFGPNKPKDGRGLDLDEVTRLNRMLHVVLSPPARDGGERGIVVDLPKEFRDQGFVETFDLTPEEAKGKQFWCKHAKGKDDQACWVLVQTQAACDHAQSQPGPLPFHLGLCLPASRARRGTPPAALWRSPCFEYNDEASFLHVNARFQLSLSRMKARQATPIFRLRGQLLNDLVYQLHGYGARPGIISFRGE